MTRNPVKFMTDVSDVTVVDRPGYLARSTIINPTGKRVEEHILPATQGRDYLQFGGSTDKEGNCNGRVIAGKENL